MNGPGALWWTNPRYQRPRVILRTPEEMMDIKERRERERERIKEEVRIEREKEAQRIRERKAELRVEEQRRKEIREKEKRLLAMSLGDALLMSVSVSNHWIDKVLERGGSVAYPISHSTSSPSSTSVLHSSHSLSAQ